ncbi:MAG: M23 family metallopeptidase [Burkholderiaceae bacterium]|jgi:murein DD-endopeptidase MepM/ murein hydrolase activator NlpD|nr:M23 family metallopeptidase [Burkholderiaceae bacterium]
MKFTTIPKQSAARESFRIINFRSLWYKVLGAVGLFALLAFGGGLWAGVTLSHRTESSVVAKIMEDPTREKLVITKLGELSARVQKLQSDAVYLVKKVSVQDQMTRKLKAIDPQLTPEKLPPMPATETAEGDGGPLLPPRVCDNKTSKLKAIIGARPETLERVEQTENSISCLHTLLDQIQTIVSERDVNFMAVPSMRPVDSGKIGSTFGNRVDPFTRHLAFHSGLDFPAPLGTSIHSAAGGRVVFTGPYSGYGNMVAIDHGNGFISRYAHASKIYVRVGDVIMPHQIIAAIGSTGRSTGSHLHFEVLYHSQFFNPKDFLSLGNMEVAADDQALD